MRESKSAQGEGGQRGEEKKTAHGEEAARNERSKLSSAIRQVSLDVGYARNKGGAERKEEVNACRGSASHSQTLS